MFPRGLFDRQIAPLRLMGTVETHGPTAVSGILSQTIGRTTDVWEIRSGEMVETSCLLRVSWSLSSRSEMAVFLCRTYRPRRLTSWGLISTYSFHRIREFSSFYSLSAIPMCTSLDD